MTSTVWPFDHSRVRSVVRKPPRSWRIVLFTASLWMGGVLFLYVGSEEAPSESYVMLLFGAGLSRFGSALAARARQMK